MPYAWLSRVLTVLDGRLKATACWAALLLLEVQGLIMATERRRRSSSEHHEMAAPACFHAYIQRTVPRVKWYGSTV